VVSGSPKVSVDDSTSDNEADHEAFIKLCEENLSVKSALTRRGCIRLGKIDGARPRRLLVHLTSANILSASKALRHSDDDYISKNVYINPDLVQLRES